MAEEMKHEGPAPVKAATVEPARFADKGIVILRDFAVTKDKAKYPHAIGGHYHKAQVIPSPTEAERAFVALKWAENLKEVK